MNRSKQLLTTWLLGIGVLSTASPARADANVALLDAAAHGDVAALNTALEHGADANAAGKQGVTALMYAAASNHPEAVRRLLEARARVDVRAERNGLTALRVAVAAGSLEAARSLLAAGADRDEMDDHGARLLFTAAANGSVPLIDLFLTPGEDIDYQRTGGFTALDAALENQHWAAAEYLLEHGATLAASSTGRRDALRKLLDLEPVVKPGSMSLVQVVDLPSPELFRAVLAQGASTDFTDEKGNTLLMLAAKRHHVTALAALLVAGADVNARNADGDTALAIATGKSEYELMVIGIGLALDPEGRSLTKLVFRPAQNSTESRATARRLDAVRVLLDAMADPNAADHGGNTPLIEATRSGDAELVAMLIAAGATVNTRNAAGAAPLLMAAQFGLAEIAGELLRAHADPAIRDSAGRTPLQVAQAGGHENVVRLLEQAAPL